MVDCSVDVVEHVVDKSLMDSGGKQEEMARSDRDPRL